MTRKKFASLKLTEQIILAYDALYVADRYHKAIHFQLYYLDDFYVEVLYNSQKRTIKVRPVESLTFLKPYWQEVSISEIDKILA